MKTIKLINKYSRAKRLNIFGSAFAGIWLIIESLQAFVLKENDLKNLGWEGYTLMVSIAVSISICIELVDVGFKCLSDDIIYIIIRFKTTGYSIKVYTYKHQLLDNFLKDLVDYINANSFDHRITFLFWLFDSELYLAKGKRRVKLDMRKTFDELKISKGAIFEIGGKICKERYEKDGWVTYLTPPMQDTKFPYSFRDTLIYGYHKRGELIAMIDNE